MDLKVVTLLTDFGMKDPYVAEMKAAILTHSPQVRIVDISHEVPKFNIRAGAFILASAAPLFPDGTVHVAVVDPGVGTKRRPIIVETSRNFYVGPDNGVIMLAASKDGVKKVFGVEELPSTFPVVSNTFHGRDVFAPVAASLARGQSPESFGREIRDYCIPPFAKPRTEAGMVLGEILYIDSFGNIVTSIPIELLKEALAVREGDQVKVAINETSAVFRLCSAYGEVPAGTQLAIAGSENLLEISVNQGSAESRFGVKTGDKVSVLLNG
jgi:S-adenosylmethionine hydrolase